jgi:periplasmic divalent cation tolerance protein
VHDYLQVLVSMDSKEEAHALQRLILGRISSAYRQPGHIEEAQEWLCLAETRHSQHSRLESLVKQNHPWDTPQILAIPVFAGYAS